MIPSVTDLKKGRRQKSLASYGGRDAVTMDRLPPHSLEMEQGVLGCIFISPNTAIPECLEKLKDDGKEAFYDLRHQVIYQTVVAMFESREPIDLITLQQRLKDSPSGRDAVTKTAQLLEQVGGIAYLSQLQDAVPSAANLSYYLDQVREKFLLRKMIQTCSGVIGRIFDNECGRSSTEVEQLLDEVEKEVLRVNESRASGGAKKMVDLITANIATVEHFFNRQGEISGLATGFEEFDKMTDGLHGGEMIAIAARPSVGKTSLAMNIAEHVALELKLPVGVFSLEMVAEALSLRMMCSIGRVNLRAIRDGFMSQGDFPKLTTAAGRLQKAPLHIDDTAGLSILQLRARARRMHQQHFVPQTKDATKPAGLFVIDYLQLLHATSRKASDNRQVEIAEISSGIKALAKELNVPVIVLSQLNRESEKDNRKPRISDLRESGAIEQDADLIGLLYKKIVSKDEAETATQPEDTQHVILDIAKQRNGPTGDIDLTFLKKYTRFESASKFSSEDVPGQ